MQLSTLGKHIATSGSLTLLPRTQRTSERPKLKSVPFWERWKARCLECASGQKLLPFYTRKVISISVGTGEKKLFPKEGRFVNL